MKMGTFLQGKPRNTALVIVTWRVGWDQDVMGGDHRESSHRWIDMTTRSTRDPDAEGGCDGPSECN